MRSRALSTYTMLAHSDSLELIEPESRVRLKPLKLMLLTVGLNVGGTEGQILEIASRLNRERFDVMVCCLKEEGVVARELRERGVRVVALGGHSKVDFRVLVKLYRLIRAERPDVIHSFLFWANLASRLVGGFLKVPLLISSYRDVDIWKRWHHITVDRLTARWAHTMTCCSNAVRQFACSQICGDEKKFVTIYNGIDVDRFNGKNNLTRRDLGLHDSLPVVGTVCRLHEPKKGLTVLLHAMAQLCERTADCCQLLIIGDGPAFEQLQNLSAKLHIDRRVVFAGARRDIHRVLPLMDIFILPSLYEGFGIAIVEAMAAGLPVIATAVGGIPEIVIHDKTGLLVMPDDSIALAEAIRTLLKSPQQAQEFGAKGRERVREKFSISIAVKQHEDLYSRCMTAHVGVSR